MPARIPNVRPRHDFRNEQIFHRILRRNFFVSVPRVIQNPRWLTLSKRAERCHPHLTSEPVELRSRCSHVVTAPELILVRNSIIHGVQTVYVRPNPHRFLLDARIDFRNNLDPWIRRLCRLINLCHKVCDRLHAEVHPFAEVRICEVAEFEISLGIESSLLLKSRDGVIVKTRPRILPAIEMRHPIWNVHVNSINASSSNLTNTLHVRLAPLRRVGADPHIFVTLRYPGCRSSTED